MKILKSGLLIVIGFVSACAESSDDNADYAALQKEGISCAAPAQVRIEPWGKSGVSESCQLAVGKFAGVENGRVILRGQFEAGRQVGIWRWYDSGENVVKVVDYSKSDSLD